MKGENKMKYLEELKEMLCKELEEIAQKGELSAGSLDTVHKLTDTIKNIDKIEMLEEGEYSEDAGNWMARGSYGGGSSYNEGGSSYRGRKRDRMGKYSRDDGMDYSEDGNSYARNRGGNRGGYSRAERNEHNIHKLNEMMENAETDREREAIRRCIQQLENA